MPRDRRLAQTYGMGFAVSAQAIGSGYRLHRIRDEACRLGAGRFRLDLFNDELRSRGEKVIQKVMRR